MLREHAAGVTHASIALAVGAVLFLAAFYVIGLYRQAALADLRDQTLERAAAIRARIEGEVNATVYLAQGVVAYINSGSQTEAGMRRAMQAVYEAGRNVRSIGVAPDNVLRYVYPLAGNERAIGLRYDANPQQWPAIQRAMRERMPVLSGPVELVQGGRALISRTPVFVDGAYWGLVSLAIDVSQFLRGAGIDGPDAAVHFALVGVDGLGERGGLIAGDPAELQQDPIRMAIRVPGGSWELAVVPPGGWALRDTHLLVLQLGIYGIALALTVMLWLVLQGRRNAAQARSQLQALNAQLAAANYELSRLSETDPLTGVPNRRGLDEVLTLEWRRCRRHGEPLSLLMVDIDQFKVFNDTYGHRQGDECLKRVASTIQASAQRAGEFVARIGGEEFMMVLPGIGDADARAQAERIRAEVEALGMPNVGSTVAPVVTISIGVATRSSDATITLDALMEAADSALYRAKREGRNQVWTVDLGESQPPGGEA
ncbi:MAG: diguanylate cyclase [Nevskiales bacterium]|nr:diguanylate cyclase [Nevskiales bacterium]